MACPTMTPSATVMTASTLAGPPDSRSSRPRAAIAERHPDLRACLTDQVVFLDGGSRVLPMAGLIGRLTLQQSDALVGQLRDG